MKVIDGSGEVHGKDADLLVERTNQVLDLLKPAIVDELRSQRVKWGVQNHTLPEWIMLIVEELGEMTDAVLKGDWKSAVEESIQVSALLVQFIERIDREADVG